MLSQIIAGVVVLRTNNCQKTKYFLNGHPGTISNLLWSLAKNDVRDIDLAKDLCDKIVEDRERLLLGEGLGVKNIALVCWR